MARGLQAFFKFAWHTAKVPSNGKPKAIYCFSNTIMRSSTPTHIDFQLSYNSTVSSKFPVEHYYNMHLQNMTLTTAKDIVRGPVTFVC